jgi:hypothetical protein
MAASHTRVRVAPNLYQRGDGRFVAGLTIAGKWSMKRLTARTKREAKLELARLQANPPQPPTPPRQPAVETAATVTEVAVQFLGRFEALVRSGERSPHTLDHYAWALRNYLLPAWGDRELASIEPDEVVALSQRLREQGRGPSVIRAVEDTASRLFGFAVRRARSSRARWPSSSAADGPRCEATTGVCSPTTRSGVSSPTPTASSNGDCWPSCSMPGCVKASCSGCAGATSTTRRV